MLCIKKKKNIYSNSKMKNDKTKCVLEGKLNYSTILLVTLL